MPDDFGSPLGKNDLITVGLNSTWLIPRRPHFFFAVHVSKKNVRAPVITSDVLLPARDRNVPPSAVSRTRCGNHHRIATVRKEVSARIEGMRRVEAALSRRCDLTHTDSDFRGLEFRF